MGHVGDRIESIKGSINKGFGSCRNMQPREKSQTKRPACSPPPLTSKGAFLCVVKAVPNQQLSTAVLCGMFPWPLKFLLFLESKCYYSQQCVLYTRIKPSSSG